MGLNLIPKALRDKYQIVERDHACAILKTDFPEQWNDILDCMAAFTLKKSYIAEPGGARGGVSQVIDGFLSGIKSVEERAANKSKSTAKIERVPFEPIGPIEGRGWRPVEFSIHTEVGVKSLKGHPDIDTQEIPVPTHEIDNYKRVKDDHRGVAVEVQWNNKDPFYDRDLTNFRLLRNLGVLSVGVIVTRMSELQDIFKEMGRGSSYGNSTTHFGKLKFRLDNGTAGGCPVLVFAMGKACYDPTT